MSNNVEVGVLDDPNIHKHTINQRKRQKKRADAIRPYNKYINIKFYFIKIQ